MTLSIQGPLPVLKLVRLAGLVMVLIGLFGMHGLASHGAESATGTDMMMSVPASGAMTTATPVAASGTQSLVNRAAIGVAEVPSMGRGGLTGAASDGPGDMSMNMAGLCVAILLVGVASLLLLLNRLPCMTALWSAPRLVALLRPLGRMADPPSLTALSVQRC